jgi:hypothetical protein
VENIRQARKMNKQMGETDDQIAERTAQVINEEVQGNTTASPIVRNTAGNGITDPVVDTPRM